MSGDHAFALELFEGLGAVRVKRMFGGAGLYLGEVMFALIHDGVIYLKTDETLRAALKEAGATSWMYAERRGPRAGVPQETSYWSLPDFALDDPEEAAGWARRALAVATARKSAKPARKRKS